MHTQICVYIAMYMYICMHICMHACMSVGIFWYLGVCMHAPMLQLQCQRICHRTQMLQVGRVLIQETDKKDPKATWSLWVARTLTNDAAGAWPVGPSRRTQAACRVEPSAASSCNWGDPEGAEKIQEMSLTTCQFCECTYVCVSTLTMWIQK